jgi:hypothetical protein
MMRIDRLRARFRAATPTASMSVATLALVMAATGGISAYAGSQIGTSDIKNNAVTSAKIKNGNVATKDLSPKARTRAWVWHPAAPLNATWPASGVIDLGTKKITVPTAGLLELNTFAVPAGGAVSADLILALVDFKGNISDALNGSDPNAIARLYDALAAAMLTDSGLQQLSVPQRVGAGKHTIRWVAVTYDNAAPGQTASVALRNLTAEFQPGVTGREPRWEVPTPRQVGRQLLR